MICAGEKDIKAKERKVSEAWKHLNCTPNVLLRLASRDAFHGGSCDLIDILLEREGINVFDDLAMVFGAYRLTHTLDQCGMTLQRGIQLRGF
jgi:hypothetical protein